MNRFPFIPKAIATSFGMGYFPYGPGTMGAIFGIGIWYFLSFFVEYNILFLITLLFIIVFTALGIWSGSVAEKYWGEDPSKVVIDETVGQWVVLLAVPNSQDWGYIVGAFVLFRLFDITKPLGIRSMEKLKGGYGIMADDILSGIYGAAVILLIRYLISI